MSKRIYELAKEKGVTNKEIVWILEKLNIPAKSHMSVLSDEDVSKIEGYYTKLREKAHQKEEEKRAEIEKTMSKARALEAKNLEDEKKDKDKVIEEIIVHKPNQRTPERTQQSRPQGDRPPQQSRPQGDRPPQQFRPQGDRPPQQSRPQGDRPPQQSRPQGDRPPQQSRPQGDRPPQQFRPQGDRPPQQARPQGDRPPQQARPQGDRPPQQPRPQGDRPPQQPRPQGDATAVKKDFKKKVEPKKPGTTKVEYKSNRMVADGDDRWKHNKRRRSKRQRSDAEKIEINLKKITLGEEIQVKDLAMRLNKASGEIIKKLITLGVMATINQFVDFDTASLIAAEYGIEEIEFKSLKRQTELEIVEDDPKTLKSRPPIVTVMGHVDHGKTSLLDAIRKTNVIATEAGGITQHIGAYQVHHGGKKITFIDTPGHAAFTSMRARGANITDIAILVVAADDGVMPQSIEAINHAKAAGVPIIVAVNKIDKEGADQSRVMQQLTEYGLVSEEWGGETIFVPVSAKNNENIDTLLEMIQLQAEMLELKANPNRLAEGFVIDGRLDKEKGTVTSLLITKGTLKIGDMILAGEAYGKVKAMLNDGGKNIKSAGPATPVEILGLSVVPEAGDIFQSVKDEKLAAFLADQRKIVKREERGRKNQMVSLENLYERISEGKLKELNVIVKGDVHGSVEALCQSIRNIQSDEVKVNIIHEGVGAITETDVKLAMSSEALIIGFNVRPDNNSKKLAAEEDVNVTLYRVIYEVIDDIKKAISGLLAPEIKEVELGSVEVRQVIKVPKIGLIAGCYVIDGKITNNSKLRVLRDGIIIFEGDIDSLKRFKDEVKEVAQGYECGLSVIGFNDIKIGDVIEAYTLESIARKLD
ncbi:MAG: translation initiation factor IF-2 [Firmicutes bacterium]|nr:translation initiation factor IF-2 [Bacillota bacterium]